jgi:GDP-4-dehydro-6-deoxy-D-mannose reductase
MALYLITGANGFCGRHLVNIIPKQNEIYGISRNIPNELISKYPDVIYERLNLLDHTSIFEFFKKNTPDYIFHFAAESSVATSWKGPINMLNNNIISQINIFEALRELELLDTKIIVACSSEEYGLIKESDLPVNENCNFNPLSAYAVSKIAQDMSAYQYYKSYGMNIVRARCFNLVGPGQSTYYALSSFAKQIAEMEKGKKEKTIYVGNLDVVRDYTDVRSAMDAYYKITLKSKGGSVYNICSGKGYRLGDLLNYLVTLSNVNIEIKIDPLRLRPSDLPVMVGDNAKIKNEIGWEPKVDIHKSINDLLNYWRGKLLDHT